MSLQPARPRNVSPSDAPRVSARHQQMAEIEMLRRLIDKYPSAAIQMVGRLLATSNIYFRDTPPPA